MLSNPQGRASQEEGPGGWGQGPHHTPPPREPLASQPICAPPSGESPTFPHGLIPSNTRPPARRVLAPRVLAFPWPGPGTQRALPSRCGHPGQPGPTCPAPSGLIRAAPASPSPAQPALASTARNHRENACLCQLCRKQNSLWFVTQIFCLFFFQNITKLKTTPPTPTPPPGRQK